MISSKPVGKFTKKELMDLEHEWRLKLKKSGFSDIEMWDNTPFRKTRKKKVKFIKGHIRRHAYNKYKEHVEKKPLVDHRYAVDYHTDELKFWKGFQQNATETSEYYRVIGLYAHHSPPNRYFEKYRELFKYYAECGYRNQAIKEVAPNIKFTAVEMYLFRNFKHMLEFVNKMDQQND